MDLSYKWNTILTNTLVLVLIIKKVFGVLGLIVHLDDHYLIPNSSL